MSITKKSLSWLITVGLLTLLVLAGPAQGFILALTLDNPSPTQGSIITFTAQVNVELGDILPIEFLTLTLSGPETQVCEFLPDGNIVGSCKGVISITHSAQSDYNFSYGYGYGYGQGYNFGYGYNPVHYSNLSYNRSLSYGYSYNYTDKPNKLIYTITLDTSSYSTGSYSTNLKVKIKDSEFAQDGPSFTISQPAAGGGNNHNDEECETTWTCAPWSTCFRGYQYRSCTLVDNECTIYPERPPEYQICTLIQELTLPYTPDLEIESDKETQSGNSPITGAVIGLGNATLTDLFIMIISALIVIGGTITSVLLRKARLRRLKLHAERFYQ